MRNKDPFFQDYLTLSTIEQAAKAEGRLLLYCGAGVTIDRTGHSWGSLILSLLPERKHRSRPDMPTRSQVGFLNSRSPESLASSVVYLLRANSGGGERLQRTLRDGLRAALYQDEGRWENGRLVEEIITLAAMRSHLGRETIILTTNYDTYLEQAYDRIRGNIPDVVSFPGLRVHRAGLASPVRIEPPNKTDPDEPGSYVDIVYLHGRLPPTGRGKVSWPLILDENSYAQSAGVVEKTIEDALNDASLAFLLGTSLSDTPLIRALSASSGEGCERLGVLLRADFAHDDDADEGLALTLARYRASELGVGLLFPDFPGQVAQLIHEVVLRQVFDIARPDEAQSLPYTDRVDAWWANWSVRAGADPHLTQRLRQMLAHAYEITRLSPAESPMDTVRERLLVELWVREGPVATKRSLRRWGRSSDVLPDGLAGKSADLERGSYLAPIRAFVDGRPRLLDVRDLDGGRHDLAQYTWKSFLCVPVFVHGAVVGVISLASTRHVSSCAMNADSETTASLVSRLTLEGSGLLAVDAPAEATA